MREPGVPTSGTSPPDKTRRNLVIATAAVGGVGVVGAAVPFVASMEPSAKARALGAPVQVSLGGIKPGELLTVAWRSKPVPVSMSMSGLDERHRFLFSVSRNPVQAGASNHVVVRMRLDPARYLLRPAVAWN